MQFTLNTSSLLVLAGLLTTSTFAADCDGNPYFCVDPGADRGQMYDARSAICGTSRWQSAGLYSISGTTGYLQWLGVGTQQACWDAFQNIIDQCSLGNNGWHDHTGVYNYNGVRYAARDCRS